MVNRRELIKWASVALGTGLSASLQQALAAGVDSTGKHDFFTVEQATMVSVISELIIPTTDTPGAIAAGVPDFIEAMVADWYTAGEREIFMMGLAQLDKHCLTQYKTVFSHCDAVQQSSALSWSETQSKHYRGADLLGSMGSDAPFFTKIKELTVLGYYTSKIGATQELRYNPMPMAYNGDVNFSDLGRQWSY